MPSHTKRGREQGAAQSARLLLLALLALVTAAAPARAQQQQSGTDAAAAPAPSAAREVRLTFTVMNERGQYIGGIERANVEVFEGKGAREITSFAQAEEHASVGVLFDISRSMREGRGNKIERARQAFARFAQQASPLNEYFVRAFNKREFELTDWTRDHATIKEALDKIAPATVTQDGDGGTALYDAVASALSKLAGGPHPRRVLLVFTDGGGDNYSSRARLKDLKRMVRDADVLLYAVAVVDPGDPGTLDFEGQAQLDELVAASGGVAYFTVGREMNEVVDRITVELRHQYVVVFAPADAAKRGELNKVRVKIKPPPAYKSALRVRSREGYLTPP